MTVSYLSSGTNLVTLLLLIAPAAWAQTDPGVRPGAPGAGAPIAGLNVKEGKFFDTGKDAYSEVASVTGAIVNTEEGLGPRFNLDSCAGCHAQPAVGGSSPLINPQVAVATLHGATNKTPSFITIDGPVREARFKTVAGVRDGGVQALFTVAGRSDAGGCSIAQPDFASAVAQNNVSFRIPTPTFGLGFIEAISDRAILANMAANAAAKAALSIGGKPNREGNTGTITRFGWKAQNKSLAIFSGEAYSVEQGVTNDLFPNERDETPGCGSTGVAEDRTHYDETQPQAVSSDIANFTNFMRFLAPPTPACGASPLPACSASVANGRTLFASTAVGCALCHTPTLMAGPSPDAFMNNQPVNLFSDLLVHRMGTGLSDDISQGAAAGDEFRTAPLWGIGQRIFFLHDGRTKDLLAAISAHSSPGSEAYASITAFQALTATQKQDILNFLRSL